MLVLTRQTGEAVVLPDCGATLTILQILGRKVRVGVKAPTHIRVHRDETWVKIKDRTALPAQISGQGNGRIKVLWFDDSVATSEAVEDPKPESRVHLTIVRTIAAYAKHLVDLRPDLVALDLDAVSGQLQGALDLLRRNDDLLTIPIILIGDSPPECAAKQFRPLIVDRLPKPLDVDRLIQGVLALFAYDDWRAATAVQFARDAKATRQLYGGARQNFQSPSASDVACRAK